MNASVKLLESVLPASVSLQVGVPDSHPSAAILGTERFGSGTLVDSAGLILTVGYVVIGADTIEVTLPDGTVEAGEVAARDYYTGLAVIRVPSGSYPAARIHSSQAIDAGSEVFIVASVGDSQRRVNTGAVSALAPFAAYWEYELERAIFTTAMNPGLGGGALYTSSGELVGIVSLDLAEVGRFTLAIPIENFTEHRRELLEQGRRTTRPPRAWLGLFCHELRDHVVVGGLMAGSPAETCGLRPGDVILAIDDQRVAARAELYHHLWKRRPGERVTVNVFRDRSVHKIAVETGDAEIFFA